MELSHGRQLLIVGFKILAWMMEYLYLDMVQLLDRFEEFNEDLRSKVQETHLHGPGPEVPQGHRRQVPVYVPTIGTNPINNARKRHLLLT